LIRHLAGREFQFKELDDPKPLFRGNSQTLNPSPAEIMENVSASFTPVPFTRQAIDFSAVTTCTKNTAFFPTVFPKKKSGPILCFSNKLKGL
jgi:hypothetical protein